MLFTVGQRKRELNKGPSQHVPSHSFAMIQVTIDSPAQFEETIKQYEGSEDPVILYFYGTEDPNTKLSWCPDCVMGTKTQ